MCRQGLFDDSGYHGFDECSIREECQADAYNRGRVEENDELLKKINEEVDMWWSLEKENSEDDANWYSSIKMLLEQLKEHKNGQT